MDLSVGEEITCKRHKIATSYQTSVLSPMHNIKRTWQQQKWNLKNASSANKFSKSTFAIILNLLQICSSVPYFVFAVLFVAPQF